MMQWHIKFLLSRLSRQADPDPVFIKRLERRLYQAKTITRPIFGFSLASTATACMLLLAIGFGVTGFLRRDFVREKQTEMQNEAEKKADVVIATVPMPTEPAKKKENKEAENIMPARIAAPLDEWEEIPVDHEWIQIQADGEP